MARGNYRRRALIRELGLVGQAESISTQALLAMQADRKAAAIPKRRCTALVGTERCILPSRHHGDHSAGD